MLNNIKNRKESGFTIIEVLIVLAIAALILVVVLIAVPNLQRNQRNSARKDEASRILTAANNAVSNNNGSALTGTEAKAIYDDAGKLQQYDTTAVTTFGTAASATLAANTMNVGIAGTSDLNKPVTYTGTAPALLVVQNAKCGATVGTYSYSSREVSMLYTLEKTSGVSVACIGGN